MWTLQRAQDPHQPIPPTGNGQTEHFNQTCSLIKSVSLAERRRWPDALLHLIMICNTTPHCVTSISPYTLMFGQKPVDQLISNTGHNWNENYVQEQSDLIRRAQAKECLMSAADTNRQRRDRRAHAGPIPVGDQVLLK